MATITHNHNPSFSSPRRPRFDLFLPLRWWLDHVEVKNVNVAHWICKLIPCQCPFERTLSLFGHTIHIPPLCKLNPLYEELIYLRLRALNYLADDCGVDVTPYIC